MPGCRTCFNNKESICSVFKEKMAAVNCSYFMVIPTVNFNHHKIKSGRAETLRRRDEDYPSYSGISSLPDFFSSSSSDDSFSGGGGDFGGGGASGEW